MKPVSVETCIDRQRSMLRRRTFVGLAAVGVCAVSAFAEPAVAGIGLGLVIVGVVLVPGAWARWRRLGEVDDWVRGQAVLQVTGAYRSKRSTVTLQLPDRAVVAPVVSIWGTPAALAETCEALVGMRRGQPSCLVTHGGRPMFVDTR